MVVKTALSLVSLLLLIVSSGWTTSGSAQAADVSLLNTHWQLRVAKGKGIVVQEGTKAPFLQLAGDQDRVSGYGGCNHFTGSYTRKDDRLEFSKIAATMRMCEAGSDQELLFFSILSETRSYTLAEEKLQLFDNDQQMIASLEAISQH